MNVSPFRRNSAVLEPDETTRRLLAEGATATRTGSGCTPKAMRGNADGISFELTQVINLPDVLRRPGNRHVTGLIEITVKETTAVVDTHKTSAHEIRERVRVEMIDKKRHVLVVFAVARQGMGKTLDGHIGQGQESVENNAMLLPQTRPELALQVALIRGKKGSTRVVDQVEDMLILALPITESIQFLQGLDTPIKYIPSALVLDILRRVAGERSDDFHLAFGQELGGVFLSRFKKYGEIASVDDSTAQGASAPNQIAKTFVEFRSPPGQIQHLDLGIQ